MGLLSSTETLIENEYIDEHTETYSTAYNTQNEDNRSWTSVPTYVFSPTLQQQSPEPRETSGTTTLADLVNLSNMSKEDENESAFTPVAPTITTVKQTVDLSPIVILAAVGVGGYLIYRGRK